MKKCEKAECQALLSERQEKDGLRFCCRACSNSAVKRLQPHSIEKMKATLAVKHPPRLYTGTCMTCLKVFTQKGKRKTCSDQCFSIERAKNGPKAAKTMTERGTHSGWHNRRGEPSYPEKYFISVFENENVTGWVRELKIGRWFIDFAFEHQKLAVEIDGRQHQDADRKASGLVKDDYLRQHGWRVLRIAWSNPRTQKGKDALHPQVKHLLEIIG